MTFLLHSFGFNGFAQTTRNSGSTWLQTPGVKRVLLATWETTVIEKIDGSIEVWGYEPRQSTALWKDRKISSIFGDPNTLLGVVDTQGTVWCADATKDPSVATKLTSGAKQAACCAIRGQVYVLYSSGEVQCFTRFGDDDDKKLEFTSEKLSVPPVYSLAASHTHILLYTAGWDPVYGRGSNRFSQLGQQDIGQECEAPAAIEFFAGLGLDQENGMVACGLFHSAVALAGDMYTFGWRKSGQLGWGVQDEHNDNGDDGIIRMPVFLDQDGQQVEELHIVKVACGSEHTVAIDDKGRVWTCGGNKYGQLGRTTEADHDPYFRLCTSYNGKAVDCHAGRWNTFISTTAE